MPASNAHPVRRVSKQWTYSGLMKCSRVSFESSGRCSASWRAVEVPELAVLELAVVGRPLASRVREHLVNPGLLGPRHRIGPQEAASSCVVSCCPAFALSCERRLSPVPQQIAAPSYLVSRQFDILAWLKGSQTACEVFNATSISRVPGRSRGRATPVPCPRIPIYGHRGWRVRSTGASSAVEGSRQSNDVYKAPRKAHGTRQHPLHPAQVTSPG